MEEEERAWEYLKADSYGTPVVTSMAPPALSAIGMIELLECDSRPTFILDLERTQDPYDAPLRIVFSNPSLHRLPRILDPAQMRKDIPADAWELGQYPQFKEWASSPLTHDRLAGGYTTSFEYQNLFWTSSTLRKRWRIISGSAIGLKDPSHPAGSQKDVHGINTASWAPRVRKENGKLQASIHPTWVDDLPINDHVQFFKSTAWSATALGPLDTWSGCLRQMTCFLMSDSRAACMFWYKSTVQSPHERC